MHIRTIFYVYGPMSVYNVINTRYYVYGPMSMSNVTTTWTISSSALFHITLHPEKLASKKFGYLVCDR